MAYRKSSRVQTWKMYVFLVKKTHIVMDRKDIWLLKLVSTQRLKSNWVNGCFPVWLWTLICFKSLYGSVCVSLYLSSSCLCYRHMTDLGLAPEQSRSSINIFLLLWCMPFFLHNFSCITFPCKFLISLYILPPLRLVLVLAICNVWKEKIIQ